MHHWSQAVHARAQLGQFLGQVLVLARLGDGEHGEMMNSRFQVFDLGCLIVGETGDAAFSRSRAP
jgi:hypothetical protein